MPDADTAVRAYSAIRAHLPLLQALSANSPFWHSRDSGLASARAQLFRAFPRSEVPPSFRSWAGYAEHVELTCAAGELPDYTFLWWDVRLHPVLGTLEVRAMDAQSSLDTVAGITALVHGLARMAAEDRGPYERSDVLAESSFRAARDGLAATIWHEGGLRPVSTVARDVLARVRPYARDVGSDAALEEIDRVLAEGGGARRRRAAYARGGMHAMLAELVAETSLPASSYASAAR
jgi:carboxylate-amine ligase